MKNKPKAARIILQYNGGFALYINSVEAFRYNVPEEMELKFNTPPFTKNINTKTVTFDATILNKLVDGKNKIAIEVYAGNSVEYFDVLLEIGFEKSFIMVQNGIVLIMRSNYLSGPK